MQYRGAMLNLNSHVDYRRPLSSTDAGMLSVEAPREAARVLDIWPLARPTPLLALPALARALGVHSLHVKDESHRLGLGSFKALGGSYAVIRLVLEEAARRLGRDVGLGEIRAPEVRAVAASMTVACATDGNHGCAVAAGARFVGATARIFVHSGVSAQRVAAITRHGAAVVEVPGSYDDAVAEAARVCARQDWLLVSDTSWPGYERIPGLIMQGYTVLVHEALRTMEQPPTHVFVQAGVGGLAAAIAGHLLVLFGDRRPTLIVVEPDRAACVFASQRAGRLVMIDRGEATVMAMLECYTPSLVAWRILSRAADAFMTITDEDAVTAMKVLARPDAGDPLIVARASGSAGLAGLLRAAADPVQRDALALNADSRVFVVNTEGAAQE